MNSPYIPGWSPPIPTTKDWGWNDQTLQWGPIQQTPAAAQGPNMGAQSNVGTLPTAIDIGNQINKYQLDYQHGGIPNYLPNETALSGTIANLLNPADAQANYDVSMHGAENAIGRGISGSGAAAESTGRLRQADIERRAALGANLLGQEVSWLPKPYDVGKQLLDPNTVFDWQQRMAIEQARLANDALNRGDGGGGGRGGGGGYGFDPMSGTTRRTPVPIAGGSGVPQIDLPPTGQPYVSTPPPYNPDTAWYDPTLSDAAQYEQMFGDPYTDFQTPFIDYTQNPDEGLYA